MYTNFHNVKALLDDKGVDAEVVGVGHIIKYLGEYSQCENYRKYGNRQRLPESEII